MSYFYPRKNLKRRSESGFTVVEMLIAMTIFLIVLSSVYGVLRIGNITRNSINSRTETIKNARLSLNAIGRDAVNAGLGFTRVGGIVPDDFAHTRLNIPSDSNDERDLLTGIIAGNNINESDLSPTGTKNDVIAFAFRDLYFNSGNSIIVTDSSESSNSIVLTTNANGCQNCKPFDLYLVESGDGKQAVVMATAIPNSSSMVLGRDDPLDLNQKANGNVDERSILHKCATGETISCFNYNPQATAKKIYWMSYSVDVDGTLVRTTYGNNTGGTAAQQIQKQPLAYGIQNFQVRYLMQDGTISDDPSAGNTNQSNLNNIVQIEITTTVKTENNDNGITRTELINISSTSSTRNLKYDIE
jgi:prepilin-type N-terminal cleavage/methylation domain-containing protein